MVPGEHTGLLDGGIGLHCFLHWNFPNVVGVYTLRVRKATMRRIKKASVKFISFVPRGANQLPVLYKGEDQTVEILSLTKALTGFDEQGELLNVVYTPEHRDQHGDIASAEVIKDMAYEFSKNGGSLDIKHDGKVLTKEQAYVAESFLVQPNDPRFDNYKDYSGNPVDVTGAWATVIKIADEKIRKLFSEQKWNGVSFAGPAVLELGKEEETIRKALDLYQQSLKQGTPDMTPQEMAALFAQNNLALVSAIKEAVAPVATKETPVEKKETVDPLAFVGDKLNKEDVRKHLANVERARLADTVDFADPRAVENYLVSLESKEDAEISKIADPKDREIAVLKRQLNKAEGRSNAPVGSSNAPAPATEDATNLTKEEKAGWDIGERMASIINTKNGHKTV
jgi:hypothetical protein